VELHGNDNKYCNQIDYDCKPLTYTIERHSLLRLVKENIQDLLKGTLPEVQRKYPGPLAEYEISKKKTSKKDVFSKKVIH